MMKKTLTILASAFVAAAACLADEGSDKGYDALAADGYRYYLPVHTNLIKGKVMGETGKYGSVRYEDVAWLRNAFLERAHFANRGGEETFMTKASNTLEAVKAMTNDCSEIRDGKLGHLPPKPIIKNPDYELDIFPEFLPADCELSTAIRRIDAADNSLDHPSISTNTNPELGAHIITNSWFEFRRFKTTNTISRTGRDNVVNIHTNIYDTSEYTNCVYISTNEWSAEDFCFKDKMPEMDRYSEKTNAPNFMRNLGDIISKYAITNRYGWMKQASNMGGVENSGVVREILRWRSESEFDYEMSGSDPYYKETSDTDTVTNSSANAYYHVESRHSYDSVTWVNYRYDDYDGQWKDASTTTQSSESKSSYQYAPESVEWWINTHVLAKEYEELDQKPPLKKMKVWGYSKVHQHCSVAGTYTSSASNGLANVSTSIVRNVRFMIPMGETSEFVADTNVSQWVYAKLTISDMESRLKNAKGEVSEVPSAVAFKKYVGDIIPVPYGNTIRQSSDGDDPSTVNSRSVDIVHFALVSIMAVYTVTEYEWETALDHWEDGTTSSKGGGQ